MKKYYVTLIATDMDLETHVLVTEDKAKAIERAKDEIYYIERDKCKNSIVEVREYTHDIEDDDCECFDYNLVEVI